ncbi:MAG: permease [Candidatus Riflebacteria bacterium]|nr:permease [Candidatus Riflebacteria bacterium]
MSEIIEVTIDSPCEETCTPPKKEKGSKKKQGEERRESTPLEKGVYYTAWSIFVVSVCLSYFWPHKEGEQLPFFIGVSIAGVKELTDFLAQHLISAIFPAFFLSAAISTFFPKDMLIKTMGKNSNPLISYPLAAFAGAVLTVCSCGILPIFMSIVQKGAGIGPAITFLYCSPAINLISLVYTWKIFFNRVPPIPEMLWGRIISVIVCGIVIGYLMSIIFKKEDPEETTQDEKEEKKSNRSVAQDMTYFGLLVVIMLTSTDLFSFITGNIVPPSILGIADAARASSIASLAGKLGCLVIEIIALILIVRAWFTPDETRKWLKRTWRQGKEILPMVFLGIFFSGMLGGVKQIIDYLGSVRVNTLQSNFIASFVGSIVYFGSIVGVNVVDLAMRWGMHKGPALSLLLTGCAISLPSIFVLVPLIGKRKSLAYIFLIVICSAFCGLVFGNVYS